MRPRKPYIERAYRAPVSDSNVSGTLATVVTMAIKEAGDRRRRADRLFLFAILSIIVATVIVTLKVSDLLRNDDRKYENLPVLRPVKMTEQLQLAPKTYFPPVRPTDGFDQSGDGNGTRPPSGPGPEVMIAPDSDSSAIELPRETRPDPEYIRKLIREGSSLK